MSSSPETESNSESFVENAFQLPFLDDLPKDRVAIALAVLRSKMDSNEMNTFLYWLLMPFSASTRKYFNWTKKCFCPIPSSIAKLLPPLEVRQVEMHLSALSIPSAIMHCRSISVEAGNMLEEWLKEFKKPANRLAVMKGRIQHLLFVEKEHCSNTISSLEDGQLGNDSTKQSSSYNDRGAINSYSPEKENDRQAETRNKQTVEMAEEAETLDVKPTTHSLSCKRCLTVLIMGETGVGKTTFINSFSNYITSKTFSDFSLGKASLTILTDLSFIATDRRFQKYSVVLAPTVQNLEYFNNEVTDSPGQSSTQAPLTHQFVWNDNRLSFDIRLIDTPGVNDVRGSEQDLKNFEKVVEHVSQTEKLDAVLILLKPNESILTTGFRSCMHNLLTKLNRKVKQNILFCFTNCCKPGDTLATLDAYLKGLENSFGTYLKADFTNMFCFDNDCFRYLCSLTYYPNLRNADKEEEYSEHWEANVMQTTSLLRRIVKMIPYTVEDTISIHYTRQLIGKLARPLAEGAQTLVLTQKVIQDQIKEIEACGVRSKKLQVHQNFEQPIGQRNYSAITNTVCTQCFEYINVSATKREKHYKSCHTPCYCSDVPLTELNHMSLRKCEMFKKKPTCSECGCRWEYHMHTNYDVVNTSIQVKDNSVSELIENERNKLLTASSTFEEKKNQLILLEDEFDQIINCSAECEAYLILNSLKQNSDTFSLFLRENIEKERKVIEMGGNRAVFDELQRKLITYKRRVTDFVAGIKQREIVPLNRKQLEERIEALKDLKTCGEIIKNWLSRSNDQQTMV